MTTTTETIRAYTVQETASALKVQEARIREEIRTGRLKASRVGRLWRIREEDLSRYLDERAASPRRS